MTVAVEAVIPCPVAQARALVCDVERIGEFSPECVAAWWLPGYPARTVGGRFERRNRVADGDDADEWIRPCQVVVFDPPREFAWTWETASTGHPRPGGRSGCSPIRPAASSGRSSGTTRTGSADHACTRRRTPRRQQDSSPPGNSTYMQRRRPPSSG
jgi:hypothetical protein